MLIDGQKWACEACIRGHRVTSCKHHDRPLIRIKRKGRPFATCTICNSTPCTAPSEHTRLKREAELKSPSSKKHSQGRLYPRHHNPNGFLPIAPRPASLSEKDKDKPACASCSASASRSASTSASAPASASASVSSSQRTVNLDRPSRRDSAGTGNWSGSEASGSEPPRRSQSATTLGVSMSTESSRAGSAGESMLSRSAPEDLLLDPVVTSALFDPSFTLLPSTSTSSVSVAQTMPLVSPLEGGNGNPFEFPLDPSLAVGEGVIGCLDGMDVDITEGLSSEDVFHVEDWSRYMWSPETGFDPIDMGVPPVTQ